MGVLVDDRRPSFEGWLERKLEGLAEGIGQEAEAAATPSARLVLVLAAVHAARTGAIRAPSSTTSTWATAGSSSPDGSARSTSSPTRSCSTGSTATPTPATSGCSPNRPSPANTTRPVWRGEASYRSQLQQMQSPPTTDPIRQL
jgi:hypothetical protein